MGLSGIDVSNWQKDVDWQAVRASGVSFAFCKATEGKTYTDPYLAQNWPRMQAAGMVRGVYHFARPSTNTPEAEAAHFVSVLANAGGVEVGDMIALDLEDAAVAPDFDVTDWALRWLQAVEAATHCRPLIYSAWWYLDPHVPDMDRLRDYVLWLAAYGKVRPIGSTIWQFSSVGMVGGVQGDCDLNRYDGTADDLRRLGKGATGDGAGTLQTAIDVTRGWSRQFAQASKELSDVAEMLARLRS